MKIVYIAHPVSMDVKKNVKAIKGIMKSLYDQGHVVPFAPYLPSLKYLDDEIPKERKIGIAMNTLFFEKKSFDEIWLYGDFVSKGMIAEIELAQKLGIPVKAISESACKWINNQFKKEERNFIIAITESESFMISNALCYVANTKQQKLDDMSNTTFSIDNDEVDNHKETSLISELVKGYEALDFKIKAQITGSRPVWEDEPAK